jgi:hypothetical protein
MCAALEICASAGTRAIESMRTISGSLTHVSNTAQTAGHDPVDNGLETDGDSG